MFMDKNIQAVGVLAAVKYLTDKELYLEPYLNGRECGFAIRITNNIGSDKKIVFSETRRSDKIVVYVGRSTDFSMEGNSPSDEVYKNARYFPCLEFAKAAEFIVEQMD